VELSVGIDVCVMISSIFVIHVPASPYVCYDRQLETNRHV
jgi:hypothetical protein